MNKFKAGDTIGVKIQAIAGFDEEGHYIIGYQEGPSAIIPSITTDLSVMLDCKTVDKYFELIRENNSKSYEDGLKDAWELAKRVSNIGQIALKRLFPEIAEIAEKFTISPGWILEQVLEDYTPQEVKEKLDEWQVSGTVETGDVLTSKESVGIVMENDGTDCFVLWKHFILPCIYSTRAISNMLEEGEIVKTDKNVADDLQGLWEKAEVEHV